MDFFLKKSEKGKPAEHKNKICCPAPIFFFPMFRTLRFYLYLQMIAHMLRTTKIKITRTGSRLCDSLSRILRKTGSVFLHCTTILLLGFCVCFVNWVFGTTGDQSHLHPYETYGYIGCFLLYCLRSIPYLSLPFGITNILGMSSCFLASEVLAWDKNVFFLHTGWKDT